MKRFPLVLATIAMALTAALAPGSAAAGSLDLDGLVDEVVTEATADLCKPVAGRRFVCMEVEEDAGGDATVRACLYDETLKVLIPWFSGVGQLACVQSHHWAYLGTPGACFGVGPSGNPSGCVASDRGFDDDDDGDIDRTKHCVIWVAGYSLCWV